MKKLFYDMPHHLLNSFIKRPELITIEMNWHPSTLILSPPPIQLPFPPPITAQDIVLKRSSSKICSKSPNAFFIYRKVYFDQLSLLNQRYKMTDVSKLVSLYWKNECREVKEAYKKIAKEVESELNERRKRDLVYSNINSNLKISRKRNSKKKGGKVRTVTTHNQNESATFERGVDVNQQGGTHFELTFSSDMQPLIHSYNADFESFWISHCTLDTLDDAISSSSDESIFTIVTETNKNLFVSETILDQNGVNDYAQNNDAANDNDDNVLDSIPAQSQNNQSSVENMDNSNFLNAQNVAFDEFCFDDNTNLNWYLQNFI
ncbi:hypothetical protein C1645_730811 [Glomus cerebriforme]|uniref:HMG box domain-containing protein n=1 Tax=Glomus cerebriforme TaxID=658196 RepID=A0A397TWM9_9GLOM|nr:hypothetical protein C1645_730811 [Glomus cerebriforme]